VKGSRGRWVVLLTVAMLVVAAAVLRWLYIQRISLFFDEFTTLWAAKTVLERGLPLFPSGNFYTHGLLFTYLESPFLWLFGLEESLLRLPSLFIGAGTAAAGAALSTWLLKTFPFSQNFVLTFTHSHCAPKVSGACDNIFSQAIPAEHQQRIDQYTGELVDAITASAQQAIELAERTPERSPASCSTKDQLPSLRYSAFGPLVRAAKKSRSVSLR